MGIKKTEQDYFNLAKKLNLEWAGNCPKDITRGVTWKCKEGHIFRRSYSTLSRSYTGCPKCHNENINVELTINILLDEISSYPIPLYFYEDEKPALQELYPYQFEYEQIEQRTKVWLKEQQRKAYIEYCKEYFSSIDRSKYKGRNKTEQDYHTLAYDYGLCWDGATLPKTCMKKTMWGCGNGHQIHRHYETIRVKYKGCSICMGTNHSPPYTLQNYLDVTMKTNRYLFWSGGPDIPKSVGIKTEWTCLLCGQAWMATLYNVMKNNSGCPYCRNWYSGYGWNFQNINKYPASKPQCQIAEMVNGIVNYPLGKKVIDIAMPEQKIAIEYDCGFWHKNSDEDRKRAQKIIDMGWRVIAVKANRKIPSLDQLLDAIALNQPYTEIVLDWKE